MRKKSRRKRQSVVENASQLKETARADGPRSSKKKSSRIDWQRAVNFKSRVKDAKDARTSFLTIEADSLKLLATSSATPKPQRSRKLESRKKFRGVGTIASCINVAKANIMKATKAPHQRQSCHRDAFCESTTSDDTSSDSSKPKIIKKKQKKKKKQQSRKPENRGIEQSKRASSAKTLRNNI